MRCVNGAKSRRDGKSLSFTTDCNRYLETKFGVSTILVEANRLGVSETLYST